MAPRSNYRAVLMNPDGKPWRDRTYNTSAGAIYWLLTELGQHISMNNLSVCPQEEEPGNCDIMLDEAMPLCMNNWVGVTPADMCLGTVRWEGWYTP